MKIAVMGCGNMAGAIVSRWLHSGVVQASDVTAVEVSDRRCASVQVALGIRCSTDGPAVVRAADLVVLGIKPQQAAQVLPHWARATTPGQWILSMLAGTTASRIESLLGHDVQVVRIMPNTPARIGKGCTAVAWPSTSDREPIRTAILPLLCALGEVVELPEERIDAFTSIAGSGPAYVFLFLQALQEAAVAQGFTPQQARTMAAATVSGAAELASDDPRTFIDLRREVTSPNGTTEAAIGVMQDRGLVQAIVAGAVRATERAAELAKTT